MPRCSTVFPFRTPAEALGWIYVVERNTLLHAVVERHLRSRMPDVLKTAGDDGTLGKMKVSTVLESLPGVGKVRAQKIMEELDISASRRVRGLGSKQRELLLDKFGKK